MHTREKTRRQRYSNKRKNAEIYPISLTCVNFMHNGNLGYLIRAAACFGASCINVIGSIPSRSKLNPLSGSLYDYVKINKFVNPGAFLDYAKNNNIQLVSAEISKGAKCIHSYDFDVSRHLSLVVGQEECGVPVEILKNSEKVYIPMPGIGFCLNTSQAANIMLYEAIKQYDGLKARAIAI